MVISLKDAYKLCCDNLGKTDGRIVFQSVTGKTVSEVLTHPENTLDADFEEIFARIKSGEPVQYVLGETEFMGLTFKVNKNVLIPRQDTELLCEWAIDFAESKKKARVLDICTGSGCIAISVGKLTNAETFAFDISEEALKVAEENNRLNDAEVKFFKADAHTFRDLSELDLILSNPPYIETEVVKSLDKNVRDFEPHLALDGGEDGLDFYSDIAKNSFEMLKDGGALAVEIGYNQGLAVSEIFKKHFGNATVLKDLSGLDRMVYGVKNI